MDRFPASPDEVRVPDWHRQVVADRLKAYKADPSEGKPWEEVRNEILARLRQRRQEAGGNPNRPLR